MASQRGSHADICCLTVFSVHKSFVNRFTKTTESDSMPFHSPETPLVDICIATIFQAEIVPFYFDRKTK